MELIKRSDVEEKELPGRRIQLMVGKEMSVSESAAMTMGFAHYSGKSGPMDPHHHAEEIVYILSATDGWIRHGGFGEEPALGDKIPLEAGMTLHFPEKEWHVFQFDLGGHVDIIFFYSETNIFSK